MVMPVAQLKTVGRGYQRGHGGIDLMAPYGSPVQAAAAGSVAYAGRYYAYGNIVDLRHADGSITRYAHLSRIAANLRPGSTVTAGETIGAIGTSGNAHGAHLHFEVRVDGHPIDPKPFLGLAMCTRSKAPTPRIEETRGPTRPGSEAAAWQAMVDARPGGLFQ